MDLKTVFTKTAKGLTQLNQKTQSLSRDLTKALKIVDGKSTLDQLSDKTGMTMAALQKALNELKKEGFIKVFEVKQDVPLTDFGGDDDFDFTAPAKLAAASSATGANLSTTSAGLPAATFGPSPYRSPLIKDQVQRAVPVMPAASATPVTPTASVVNVKEKSAADVVADLAVVSAPVLPEVDEAVLIAARIKAQGEARARAEREAEVRARLEVEARARRDAELRALEEAKRAQQAAENARAELELKLAEEKKQREIAAATREQMSRDQLAMQAEQQRALAAARAKAEAEAQALSLARAAAESEAKALAEARVQADAAAKQQAIEFESAQRDLRQQLKAEIEAQVRAEMETMLKSDIEESARVEVEAAVRKGAQEDARRMLEERLVEERTLLDRAGAAATVRAEVDAKNMLAAQEAKIRAEMEERFAALTAEKIQAESKARKMAEAQAEAAAKAAAEFSAKLKAEEEARQKVQAKAEAERVRLEQLARTEATERARVEAEMTAKLAVEKAAKVEAEARALIEQELREKSLKASQAELAAEKAAKAEAEARALAEKTLREKELKASQAALAAEKEGKTKAEARALKEQALQEKNLKASQAELAAEKAAKAEAQARALNEQGLREKAALESQAELENERKAREEADRSAAAQRLRLEARAREEAEERADVEATMIAKLAAEKDAKAAAEERARSEKARRKDLERSSKTELESERRAREEAELKAETESKAREVASRAVSEHAAERERIELAAEARLRQERLLREKAEEKSRLEEEAETASRLAQVERLRELQEQAARSQADPIDALSGKRRRPVKREKHIVRWTVMGLVSLLVLAVVLIQVVPLGAVNVRLEKALAGWVHDDVSSTGLRIGLFPRPHVKLDQVALGKLFDAKATSGKIYMDMTALFGDRFIIDTFELNDVSITADALNRASRWGDPEGRASTIEIGKVVLKDVKLDIKGVNLDVFDADIKFDKTGTISDVSLRTRGNKWTLDIARNKAVIDKAVIDKAAMAKGVAAVGTDAAIVPAGNTSAPALTPAPTGDYTVDFSAREVVMPIGAPVPLNIVSAKGFLSKQQMLLTEVSVKLLEGNTTGSLKLDWAKEINVTGNFVAQKIKLDQLTEVFTRDVSLAGKMEGDFSLSATASRVGVLLDQPKIQGNFIVKDGAIGNADLVQVMRSPDRGGAGGQSKFSDFGGQLRVSDGIIRYEKLRFIGGVLFANGYVSVVSSTSALAGSVNAEIRSNVAQDRAVFAISGTVARPQLKRAGQ